MRILISILGGVAFLVISAFANFVPMDTLYVLSIEHSWWLDKAFFLAPLVFVLIYVLPRRLSDGYRLALAILGGMVTLVVPPFYAASLPVELLVKRQLTDSERHDLVDLVSGHFVMSDRSSRVILVGPNMHGVKAKRFLVEQGLLVPSDDSIK